MKSKIQIIVEDSYMPLVLNFLEKNNIHYEKISFRPGMSSTKKHNTLQKIYKAVKELHKEGKRINYSSVSRRADLSRITVTKHFSNITILQKLAFD